MIGLVVGSGNPVEDDLLIERASQADLVIAADGGWSVLNRLGLKIDLVMGDYDSISEVDYKKMEDSKVQKKTFSSHKDFTDMEAAVSYMVDQGMDKIYLTGAIGNRFDHSLGNIFMMDRYHDMGIRIIIEDFDNRIEIVGQGETRELRDDNFMVSLLSLTKKSNISLDGMEYNLNKSDLLYGSCFGVSNQIKEKVGQLIVHSGRILLIRSKD